MSRAPRQVVVSGGTGALGRAVTAAFLGANDRVVVPWIDVKERAELERAEADAVKESRLELVEADVAEASGAAAVAAAAGPVDVLVNGVGDGARRLGPPVPHERPHGGGPLARGASGHDRTAAGQHRQRGLGGRPRAAPPGVRLHWRRDRSPRPSGLSNTAAFP